MPTGETPAPSYDYGGGNLPFGAETALTQLQQQGQIAPDFSGQPPEPLQPSSPEEAYLFSPTDRPNEPLTHGAPIGPGANITKYAYESSQAFNQRLAGQLSNYPDPTVKAFAQRVAEGL